MRGSDWTFRAMGTQWRIHHAGGVSRAAAQRVADAVHQDERRWSRFLPTSDVRAVSAAAGRPVSVAVETVALVAAAVDWSTRTGGVFQPLVGRALHTAGYRQRLGDAADSTPCATAPTRVVDASAIVVTERTVAIPAGTVLDLGGIGKSWSAVRAGRLLCTLVDDDRLLLDAGGDVALLRGDHVVRTPAGDVRACEGEGVATSSSEGRRWTGPAGAVRHHLIDPVTGAPGPRGTAVVVGQDPVVADVLASCVVLRPDALAESPLPAAHLDVSGTRRQSDAWATRALALTAVAA